MKRFNRNWRTLSARTLPFTGNQQGAVSECKLST